MATRNRTIQYKKHRDAVKSVRAPLSSSVSGLRGPVIEMVNTSILRSNHASYTPLSTEEPGPSSSDAFTIGLPPAWVDDTEEIAANIQIVRTKMAELVKAHSKALMPSFGDGREDQRTIEVLTREITDLLRKSEKRLQKLPASESPEDSNIRKNVQHSLATDLQNLSMDLRRRQSTYLKRLQQQKEGHDGVGFEMSLNEKKPRYKDDEFGDMGFKLTGKCKDDQNTCLTHLGCGKLSIWKFALQFCLWQEKFAPFSSFLSSFYSLLSVYFFPQALPLFRVSYRSLFLRVAFIVTGFYCKYL
uniref:Syntaxin N-terminal domain-containing protein n=1 Tax=Manihot esculenta TaxID=3983 RepID=A0A2C9WQJ5_MANES